MSPKRVGSALSKHLQLDRLAPVVRQEWILGVGLASSLLIFCFGGSIMGKLANPLWLTLILLWLFSALLACVLCVVRHSEHLAVRLGEPYGTLILTLAVTSVEVIAISAVMLHGENNPTLARDTLLAIVMIILNGMVGLSLLLGGWRHREQQYNFQGTNAYLSVIIPIVVLTLMLPTHTVTTAGPTLSTLQETFLAVVSVGLYATFLAIQTGRHRAYFSLGGEANDHESHPSTGRSLTAHTALLVAY